MSDLIIIGGGGHAKVIADIAVANHYNILGFLDDNPNTLQFSNLKRLGKISDCIKYNDVQFIIAIGNNTVRQNIAKKYPLNFATLIHPSAIVSKYAQLAKGTVVMPLCVINSHAKIGEHCIINTSSVIEHDANVNNYTHISPNATLCGTVNIGENCHIGAGATIINNITICDNCIIGAGAAVTNDIIENGTYVGVPAQKIK